MNGLENLQGQVKSGMENIRLEAEQLQRINETIRLQRESLEHSFHEFEQKYTLFHDKGEPIRCNRRYGCDVLNVGYSSRGVDRRNRPRTTRHSPT